MSPDEIKNILDQHAIWLVDNTTGKRADLSGADLSGADLSDANLSDASLTGAKLTGATIAHGWKLVRA